MSFLAVAVIMALLIGFVLVILRSLAASAGVRIRGDMVKLLESYDRIIDEKSREVRRLQGEAEGLRASLEAAAREPAEAAVTRREAEAAPAARVPPAATYRPAAFGGSYGTIREHFRLSQEECASIIERVSRQWEEEPPGRGSAAARLRRALSFDTVFRLAQMAPEAQLELLDTALEDRDWTLLRDFCEGQLDAPFDITRFCDWLEERAALEGDRLLVRLGESLGDDPEAPAVCLDEEMDHRPKICEGIQVVAGNKLYDYSINEREIS